MAAESATEAPPVTYEELAAIEEEFEEVDTQIIRHQYQLSKPLYEKRSQALGKIPAFWAIALEQAPPEIDQIITPEDSRLLADLTNITVTRPEIEDGKKGHPRSVSIRFDFKPNDRFEDAVLEKHFHYRRSLDGWAGLVSEPVKINWKKGQDLTEGLTDLAYSLFQARKKVGDMKGKGLPEFTAAQEKVENWNVLNTSFFTWFGFISEKRYVSAEESEQATKEHAARREARAKGDEVDLPETSEADVEADEDHEAVELCPENGETVTMALTDDFWPNAIKYFTSAQEMGDISDADFEEFDEDDEMDDEDGEGEPVDIRSLVADKGDKARSKSDGGPPAKKAKK